LIAWTDFCYHCDDKFAYARILFISPITTTTT